MIVRGTMRSCPPNERPQKVVETGFRWYWYIVVRASLILLLKRRENSDRVEATRNDGPVTSGNIVASVLKTVAIDWSGEDTAKQGTPSARKERRWTVDVVAVCQ